MTGGIVVNFRGGADRMTEPAAFDTRAPQRMAAE